MIRLPLIAIGCLALLIFLAGCAGSPLPAVVCPGMKAYTDEEQKQLADELASDGPETIIQLEDYVQLRSACRKTAGK